MDMKSLLCDLVEVLEGTRAMHDDAARSSTGDQHMRHEEKASCYTAMLKEVRNWQERTKRERSAPSDEGMNGPDDDGFPALIDRISRM